MGMDEITCRVYTTCLAFVRTKRRTWTRKTKIVLGRAVVFFFGFGFDKQLESLGYGQVASNGGLEMCCTSYNQFSAPWRFSKSKKGIFQSLEFWQIWKIFRCQSESVADFQRICISLCFDRYFEEIMQNTMFLLHVSYFSVLLKSLISRTLNVLLRVANFLLSCFNLGYLWYGQNVQLHALSWAGSDGLL